MRRQKPGQIQERKGLISQMQICLRCVYGDVATHQRRLDELNVEAEDGAPVRVQLQDPDGRHDAGKLFKNARIIVQTPN